MVKTRQQKSKPSKQHHVKKHGKQGGNMSEFRLQLDALGLRIFEVTADGNCLFRALADQLEGNEDEHDKYRKMVVQYIMNNRETFEPFIEDEVPFDEYCQLMEKDGTWAGHMELQAASLVTRCNICIHRNMSPRWYIRNFDNHEVRMIHLSYHDGEHYNSVRSKEDTGTGPARPIIIKADADLSATSHHGKRDHSTDSKGEAGSNIIQVGSIKMVMAGSGCDDKEKVEEVLHQVSGDVDAAIEFLIAEQNSEDSVVEKDNKSSEDTAHGNHHNEYSEQNVEKIEDEASKHESTGNSTGKSRSRSSMRQDEKKTPRNKVCPCGSRKKYKNCCGAVTAKPSVKLAVTMADDHGKSRKGKRQGKKSEPANVSSSSRSNGGTPDLGALCI